MNNGKHNFDFKISEGGMPTVTHKVVDVLIDDMKKYQWPTDSNGTYLAITPQVAEWMPKCHDVIAATLAQVSKFKPIRGAKYYYFDSTGYHCIRTSGRWVTIRNKKSKS
jgi:hypothetical protein